MSSREILICVIAGALGVVSLSGCRGLYPFQQKQTPPAVFVGQPTIDDIVQAIHANSRQVHQLRTDGAELKVNGLPALRAELDMEPPRNVRLRAQLLALTGPELDLGSNNEEFWFWVKRNQEPAVYFARHAEFALTPTKHIIPVEPEWLFEALGVVNFDAGGTHTGPYFKAADRFEVHSRIPTPTGEISKIMLIDARFGWILEQYVRDPRGQLLATARAQDFRYYQGQSISMPHRIDISFPPARQAFQLQVNSYILNEPVDPYSDLWSRPEIDGYPPINLAGGLPPLGDNSDPNIPIRPPRTSQRLPAGHERLRGFR